MKGICADTSGVEAYCLPMAAPIPNGPKKYKTTR